MAARVEDGVEILCPDISQSQRRAQRLGGLGIRLESLGRGGLGVGFIAFGIEGWLATTGRGKHDLRPGILEHIIGGGEFLQPETGLLTGVAQLVVRRENHQ